MKKAILFVILLSFSLLFFAKPAEAIYVKVTFVISNVTIPIRAVAAQTPLVPTTEMGLSTSVNSGIKMEIVRNSDNQVVSQKWAGANYLRRNVTGAPGAGNWFIVFKNDGGSYTPRITLAAMGPSTNIAYIDCSGTTGATASYYTTVYTESVASVNCQTGGSNMVSPQYLYFNFPSI